MSIYANDADVAALTQWLVASNLKVFQIFQRGTEREHVEFLLSEFNPPPGMVLDVGCGVGEVSRLMSECRPDLEFILLNISQSQLDMCPDYPKIHASAESIPLPSESVDSVMACYVMGHLNKEVALPEMRRVLRPGGVLFIVDMTGGEIPALDYTAHEWNGITPDGMNTDIFSRLMPEFAENYPQIKPVIYREVKPCAH